MAGNTVKSTEAMRAELEKRLQPAVAEFPAGDDVRRLALSRMAPDELEPVYTPAGHVTEQTKRANVFRTLSIGKSPVLTNNQAAYGQELVEIYAKWKGSDGGPEFDALSVRVSGGGKKDGDDHRLEARDLYNRIMTFVGPTSARLLTALCDDWVLGDGRLIERDAAGKPVMRWRAIVTRFCGDAEPDRQSVYVKIACRDLESWFSSWRRGV